MKAERSIDQQIRLFEGRDHWHLNTDKEICCSDGPNGLRIEDSFGLGFNHSKEATVFPTASCTACSFDRDLLEEYGRMLAEECISENVDVILGPGVNTKRSPLGGRNFEYFSEDPLLSGELAAAYIHGVQSQGIGTSLKHYAANSRELGRQVVDSIVDERTLHELYLRPFEIAVKKSQPWSIMAAYNQLNGIYCCQNRALFQEARSWGFDGVFISDWGGISDPVRSLEAGLNIEMPGPTGSSAVIHRAFADGDINEACIQESAAYVECFAEKCHQYHHKEFDQKKHDLFCEKAAEKSIVLLKNNHVLPLRKEEKIAVIGPLAIHPRIQGNGSANVNAKDQDWLLKVFDEDEVSYSYAQGYPLDEEEIDETMHEEALKTAKGKDKVIVLVGESKKSSGEGFDRSGMDLPFNQNSLIRDLIHAGSHVIVVIQTGAPVCMPWRDMADGVIAEYEAGARSGTALKKVLFGDVNPSGHLAETWPLRCEDNPSYRYYDAEVLQMQYREGIFAGYRYYDTFVIPVAYPFGYGLSYTTYACKQLKVQIHGDHIDVTCIVQNTGSAAGRAVVQIYQGMTHSRIARAEKELCDFASVELQAGEEKELLFHLSKDRFAYYDTQRKSWQIESGTYRIMAGFSVADIVQQQTIELDGIADPYSALQKSYIRHDEGMVYVTDEAFACMLEHEIPAIRNPRPFTPDTTIRELKACGLGKFVNHAVSHILHFNVFQGVDDASIYNAPIRQLLWLQDHYTWDTVSAATAYMNHHGIKELQVLIDSLKKKKE